MTVRVALGNLRYRKIVLTTDQDEDGSHINSLIIEFIHSRCVETQLYCTNETHEIISRFHPQWIGIVFMENNKRSIPCMMDVVKPVQRTMFYTCFKRILQNILVILNVPQLTGSYAELSAYCHGEVSPMCFNKIKYRVISYFL